MVLCAPVEALGLAVAGVRDIVRAIWLAQTTQTRGDIPIHTESVDEESSDGLSRSPM